MMISTRHINGDEHVRKFPHQSISKLAPFSALILSIILVVYALLRLYALETSFLPKLYGKAYSRLNETNRRGFLNHHIAGATKIIILILAAYPFIAVAFGKADYHSLYVRGSSVTLGDILIVAAQMLMGMYVFELIYRVKVSPVSVVHHVGTILVGQSAIAISLRLDREKDATIEFLLCTVWGAFDIVSEFLPHVAIILYRVYPTKHSFLCKLFRLACFTTLTGTICETVVTMYLFGSLWERWTIAFKIVTPVLHVAFSAAQLHGTWVFYKMWRKEKRAVMESKDISVKEEGVGAAAVEENVVVPHESEGAHQHGPEEELEETEG